MTAIYRVAILAYGLALRLAAWRHPKAAAWCRGRRELRRRMSQPPACALPAARVWVHCASLGEFEQARPLMEAFYAQGWEIFLTFFSPSGYSRRKDYVCAREVSYLPLDTPANARAFLKYAQPQMAVFIRYEFWYFHLRELQRRQIPTYLVSASFREGQPFFRPFVGAWFRGILGFYTRIFTIDKASQVLLAQYSIRNVSVAGDTRADRVMQIAREAKVLPQVVLFRQGGGSLIVCGSTWPQDIQMLLPAMAALGVGSRWVIAPHEVDAASLSQLEVQLSVAGWDSMRFSQYEASSAARILIMDNMGLLAHLYQYADVAVVGGGWGKGIHNVLEPAAHAVPVIWGPVCWKFPEALGLAESGGGVVVEDAGELTRILGQWLADDGLRQEKGRLAKGYVGQLAGAASFIMRHLGKG